jgi:hypothetical protein
MELLAGMVCLVEGDLPRYDETRSCLGRVKAAKGYA